MTDHKPSGNLWALSSLASTIGAGDFAVEDHDSFQRQEFVFAALNLLLIGALFALQAISKIVRGRPSQSVIVVLGAGFTIQAVYFIWLRTRNASNFPEQTPVTHVLVSWIQLDTGVGAHLINHQGRHCLLRADASSHTRSGLQARPWRHDRGDRAGGLHQLHGRVRAEIRRVHRSGRDVGDLQRDGSAGVVAGQQSSRARGKASCAISRNSSAPVSNCSPKRSWQR